MASEATGPGAPQTIEAYGNGGFLVSGERYQGSVLITARETRLWPLTEIEALSAESFDPIFEMADDFTILILGCGPAMALIGPEIRSALRDRGVVLEPMDSGAACRTYNVLQSEGRPVAAAILAVD